MPVRATHALFPGSFDPLTLGHLDLAQRACELFGRVTLGIAANADKRGLFTLDERVALAREATLGMEGFAVAPISGLTVDAARALGADVIVRGVRGGADCEFELALARMNGELSPGLETLLLVPAPAYAHVSSTLVRQIALAGADASRYVPIAVSKALERRARG